jgi:hypothetical protein
MVTRQVKQFSDLEQQLITAANAKDVEAIGQLLENDFSLRVSNHLDDPTNRAEAITQFTTGNSLPSHVAHLAALDYGDITVVSFHWLSNSTGNDATTPGFFVVDTWKKAGDKWKIIARYASPIGGNELSVPGDVHHESAPNKKI